MAVEQSELAALREGIADVLASECESRALHDHVDGKNDLETRLWRHAAELGWLGVGIAEANGGLGLGVRGLDVLHQELGRRLAPGAYIATLAAAQWVEHFGDEATKKRVLGPVLNGEMMVAIPADLGSGRNDLVHTAGALSGRPRSLLGSPQSRLAVVGLPAGGLGLIEVDGAKARLSARRPWDPTRALCDLECNGVKPLLSVNAPGAREWLAHVVSLAVIADSVSAAETIYLQTVDYQKTRVQFDRPLASFQALKHRAADMKIAHDISRHVAGQALAAAGTADADLWAGLAKAWVTDTFAYIATDCVQLHGGVGFTWDFDCHLFLKRAKLNQALVGSNEAQTDRAFDAMIAAMKEGRSTLEIES